MERPDFMDQMQNMVEVSARDHMDQIYRYQRHIYDATRKFYLLGRDRLIGNLKPQEGEKVLEIGCGTGRNLICASRAYPQAKFFGIDISTAMLETAQKSIDKAGLQSRIQIAYGDATGFHGEEIFGQPAYDKIFISYALSMIPPWQDVLHQAVANLREGGFLHLVDFGQQEKLPSIFKKALHAWLEKFSVFPIVDLEKECAHLARRHNLDLTFKTLYRGYSVYAVLQKQI